MKRFQQAAHSSLRFKLLISTLYFGAWVYTGQERAIMHTQN
jgi:hypothetical protein